MNTLDVISSNVDETIQIGRALGELLTSKDTILLDGDLGAGKTHLTKGIARGLQIDTDVVSPTFNLVCEYKGSIPLYHFDMYRLDDVESLEDIDFYSLTESCGVSIIEWAQKFPSEMPEDALQIVITKLDENERKFSFKAQGIRAQDILTSLSSKLNKEA